MKNKIFSNIQGERVELIDYILYIINNKPITTIHVGTDASHVSGGLVYYTVIAFRYGKKGAHFIKAKNFVKGKKTVTEKLRLEGIYTIELAMWLKEQIPSMDVIVELDYNINENYKSNVVISEMKGWAEGMGFTVTVKPDEQIAVKAADHLCP